MKIYDTNLHQLSNDTASQTAQSAVLANVHCVANTLSLCIVYCVHIHFHCLLWDKYIHRVDTQLLLVQ